jgi:hypothetical protein
MYKIAQQLGVSLQGLVAANPHITDPNILFINDVLCVPAPQLPCTSIFQQLPNNEISGSASLFVHTGPRNRIFLDVISTLPPLTDTGYDEYNLYIEKFYAIEGYYDATYQPLVQVPGFESLWATTMDVSNYLSRNTYVTISADTKEFHKMPPGEHKILRSKLLSCK